MYQRTLRRMQERIRLRQYVMTLHAEREMNDDGLTIHDVEHGILTGAIQERQNDRDTGEWKYRISGNATSGMSMEIIAKISPVDKLVIITVYLA